MVDDEFVTGTRLCSGCGAINYGSVPNCLRCGSELPLDPVGKKEPDVVEKQEGWVLFQFCPQCGKPVPQDQEFIRFCRHCGRILIA